MSEPRLGVLGAGTMGSGIAQVAALGGYVALLYDVVPEAAEAGAERARAALAKGVERGRWSAEGADAAATRLLPVTDLAALAGCELVIEAAPEDLALKRDLLAAVGVACGPDTVLATNTSSLRVTDIAAGVPGPERVVGMHFFNPPALMELVEIVAAEGSSPAAQAVAEEAARRMGRTPIRARDTPGFVANRLARPFYLESLRMLADEVADAPTIDRAVRAAGFRMGPFELIDLIGLDVNLEIARSFFAQGGEPERWRPNPIQERLVAAGRLGRKSGAGYYAYTDTPPSSAVPLPRHAPERNSGTAGEPPAEILQRLYAQIANEAAFALEDEIASPADIETAVTLGLNWPLGPLAIAELIGAARAVAVLDALRATRGDAYLVAPRLRAEAEGEEP